MTSKNVKINPRVRLIIIKKGKILMSYVKDEDFYFFIGGKMEYGETLEEACKREVQEECRASFELEKILYIRDYIKSEIDEHSIEIYIKGDIDKFKEVEGMLDDEFDGNHWQTWISLNKLKDLDVRPKELIDRLIKDYKNGFNVHASYLGEID
jgi:ADP-ribose pyrophosphatase YjhB (NUDIX family)